MSIAHRLEIWGYTNKAYLRRLTMRVRAGGLGFYSRDFYEAVGELAEGQAPHSQAWEERLS